MATRLLTLLVWVLLASSTMFWGLKALARPSPLPEGVRTVIPTVATVGTLERVLGAAPVLTQEQEEEEAAVPAQSRFVLLGVVAPQGRLASHGGLALIEVDGQPARAWRTGAVVVDELVLKSVSKRGVVLAAREGGAAPIELSLPEPGGAPVAPGVKRVPGVGGGMASSTMPGVAQQQLPRPGMPGGPRPPQQQAQPQQLQPPQQPAGGDEEEE